MKLSGIFPFIYIFVVSVIFFSPYFFSNKVPLPVDALVGAHVPWTETKWAEYPAGVPIKNLEITDAFSQFYPWRQLVGEFWRSGQIPLWNHYMFSGTPFLATLHSASLYPLNFLYLIFDDQNAWSLLVYFQILLSGFFTYLFLRRLNLSVSASLFGAIAFSYSGYMIAWLEFATGGHAGLWLPFILWCLHKYNIQKEFTYIFLTAIGFFFIYTAGDFQVPLYISVVYVTYAYFLFRKQSVDLFKSLFGYICGILLSLPQLIPTVELYLKSVRQNDPYIVEYFYGLMHWQKLTNFIWPDFYGNVVTGNYWGQFGFHEYMGFFGVTSLVLLFYVFTKQAKSLSEKYFKYGLIVALVMLFPTPVAYLPYILQMPGLGTSSASRILFVVGFFASILAAFGLDKLKVDKIKKITLCLIAISLFVGSIIYLTPQISHYGISLFPNDQTKINISVKNMLPGTIVLVSILTIIYIFKKIKELRYVKYIFLILLTAEMLWYASKNTPFSPKQFVFPETGITTFLQDKQALEQFRIAGGIPVNLFMPYKIQSVEGYDPIYPEINSQWFSLVNSKELSALSGRYGFIHDFSSKLLPYANLKYIVDYPKNRYGGIDEEGVLYNGNTIDKYSKVFEEGRISVYESKNYYPRVWLSNEITIAKNQKEVIDNLLLEEGKQIVLESNIDIKPIQNPEYMISNYNISNNQISFDIETNLPSFVFHSISYDNNWKLYVNDIPTKIYKANFIFQSFQVDSGVSKIQMVYKPDSFYLSIKISIITFISLLISIFLITKKQKL